MKMGFGIVVALAVATATPDENGVVTVEVALTSPPASDRLFLQVDQSGDHLLISAAPERAPRYDEAGRIQRSIRNFDLIRKL